MQRSFLALKTSVSSQLSCHLPVTIWYTASATDLRDLDGIHSKRPCITGNPRALMRQNQWHALGQQQFVRCLSVHPLRGRHRPAAEPGAYHTGVQSWEIKVNVHLFLFFLKQSYRVRVASLCLGCT